MARGAVESHEDRYIVRRAGVYHYKRRVPAAVADFDSRAPHARASLKTKDLAIARLKRDALEAADDALWASFLEGGDKERAAAQHRSAVRRAEALGFSYRTAASLVASRDVDHIVDRIHAVMRPDTPKEATYAVLGAIDEPQVTVSDAFDVYLKEIAQAELRTKSRTQRASWEKVKRRALTNFVEIVGDKGVEEVTREDALALYRYWLARVAPEQGRPTHSPSSGNRDLGNMRVLFDDYFKYIGRSDRQNPFAGLSFTENKIRSRPPYATDWIITNFLQPGLLANMNPAARGIVLAMVETGARPSELCNMRPENVVLDHEVPHLRIEPSSDSDDPFEIKTQSSIRCVPLVGVSLAVYRAHPNAFPTLRDRHNSVTAAIGKFFRENNLRPTPKHSLYSLRHSFEDRMKNGKVDVELRKMLMGHTIDRPKYGEGGEMKMWQSELKRIALPFDPSIV